jgi:hypothetical protein
MIKPHLIYSIFIGFCVAIQFASPASGAYHFQGTMHFTGLNINQSTNTVHTASITGTFDDDRYDVRLVIEGGDLISRTVFDGRDNYLVNYPVDGSIPTDLQLPSHVGNTFYPYDARIYTRMLVSFLARISTNNRPEVLQIDPWIEPRTQVALDATTALNTSTRQEGTATFITDPKVVRSLIKNPRKASEVRLTTSGSDIAVWSGYAAEARAPFTNSVFAYRLHPGDPATVEIRSTRFYHPKKGTLSIVPMEQLMASLILIPTNTGPNTFKIDARNYVLGVYDHRLKDRSLGVDGVEYELKKEEWIPADSDRATQAFQKRLAVVPKFDNRVFDGHRVIIYVAMLFVLGALPVLMIRSRKGKTKTVT